MDCPTQCVCILTYILVLWPDGLCPQHLKVLNSTSATTCWINLVLEGLETPSNRLAHSWGSVHCTKTRLNVRRIWVTGKLAYDIMTMYSEMKDWPNCQRQLHVARTKFCIYIWMFKQAMAKNNGYANFWDTSEANLWWQPNLLNTDDEYSNVLKFAVIACNRTARAGHSKYHNQSHIAFKQSPTTYFQLQNKLAYAYR